MLRKIGTLAQAQALKEQLHPDLYQAITHDLYLMDSIYGSGRSYFTHGGYSVIVDSKDDLPELQNIIDLKSHAPEELQFYSSYKTDKASPLLGVRLIRITENR